MEQCKCKTRVSDNYWHNIILKQIIINAYPWRLKGSRDTESDFKQKILSMFNANLITRVMKIFWNSISNMSDIYRMFACTVWTFYSTFLWGILGLIIIDSLLSSFDCIWDWWSSLCMNRLEEESFTGIRGYGMIWDGCFFTICGNVISYLILKSSNILVFW